MHGAGLLACVLIAVDASAQSHSDWQAQFTVASDYRHHGLSQLTSGVAAQAAVDYRHYSGLFVGGVVNNVDYTRGSFDSQRDVQVSAYAGFGWDFPAWDFNAALHRYAYPGAVVDYDYTAVAMSAIYRERVLASVSYTDALFALWGEALDYELGLIWSLAGETELTATVGRFRARALGDTEYTHWNVGVSKIHRRLGIDVRYYGNSESRALPIGDPSGRRWVLSMSYAVGKRS